MTATVISFSSRRNPATGCQSPRHQPDALAGRVRNHLDTHAGELLIPRDLLLDVLEDLTATTHRLIPPTERTKP